MLNHLEKLIGTKVVIHGHFNEPVIVDGVNIISSNVELRVRLIDGSLRETILSEEEALKLLPQITEEKEKQFLFDPEGLRIIIESYRIQLAYSYDKHFAVSLSGIRTLPHQIEAVYQKMLPLPQLRFLLADDPGAGKTIMAGLLLKEMKLREAIDKILILSPAPLTIQWQDEMLNCFGEYFEIISSAVDSHQLVDPWHKNNQVISSLDYAKQENVRERVWKESWDIIIIDEAHKCSASTKSYTSRSNEAKKTKRYQLAEKLSEKSANILLLTATPHHGDDDRFGHFVRLIDADIFPEPHKLGEKAKEIRQEILKLGPDCPWALRRLKEDLKDTNGQRLFPDRFAHTITFKLNQSEFDLYKAVSGYINEFLPQATGKKKQSVALARTVFQRRLASSTYAIYQSLNRRLERQKKLLQELEDMTPAQRAKKLSLIQKAEVDDELEDGDLNEDEKDQLIDEFTLAEELSFIKSEIVALSDLTDRSKKIYNLGTDSKLSALKDCLENVEFNELKDGRGKLIIFTEHRDTLNYINEHLEKWGYTTVEIHGGMNPRDRKRAQDIFRTAAQILVATEAAGEGINLQFCHLMINYDLPWNPTRLEQRLGRIHRIGQVRDVHAFNFVANESEDGRDVIEGRILERLLTKIEQMRIVLDDRVFDVIGQILSLNDINLPEMLREVAYDPRRLDDYIDQINKIDPKKYKEYEKATGVALARSYVDFSEFYGDNLEIEEQRLMPKYVEEYFLNATKILGLEVERRADGLLRLERVPKDFISEKLEAIKRFGKPEKSYRKFTFHKEHLEEDKHVDASLIGPGHSLYAVVDEKLKEKLSHFFGGVAAYVDGSSEIPYCIYFFEATVIGETTVGKSVPIYGELVAVKEILDTNNRPEERFTLIPPDSLTDLQSFESYKKDDAIINTKPAMDFVKVTYQIKKRGELLKERERYAEEVKRYLTQSFKVRIRREQNQVMELEAKRRGPQGKDYDIALRVARTDLDALERMKDDRLKNIEHLKIARPGPLRHIGTALVLPHEEYRTDILDDISLGDLKTNQMIEKAAEDIIVRFEESRGWTTERIGHLKKGFDIRSIGPADPQTGRYEVRRIEAKGRQKGQPIILTFNEWFKAEQLGDSYWLYVVWDPIENPNAEPILIQNPVKALDHVKKRYDKYRVFSIPAESVEFL